MSEQTIIEQCAPTLAGIKTGSLFSVQYDGRKESVLEDFRKLNRVLRKKGLRAFPVRYGKKRVLVYLFRPDRLRRDLKDPNACAILTEKGYVCGNADCCLVQLIRRFACDDAFPHEVGLFLSYPPSDVKGFMRHSRNGVKSVGYWKVYTNQEEAEKTFARYRRCTEVYMRQFQKGRTLAQLTV